MVEYWKKTNGKDLGVVWMAPWQVEITGAVKEGENQLEIEEPIF